MTVGALGVVIFSVIALFIGVLASVAPFDTRQRLMILRYAVAILITIIITMIATLWFLGVPLEALQQACIISQPSAKFIQTETFTPPAPSVAPDTTTPTPSPFTTLDVNKAIEATLTVLAHTRTP